MKNSHYIPAIDGLRAIAVIFVVIFHMDVEDFFSGGFIGVDMFFVLSGFVISRSLYNKRSLLTFYESRIQRILPPLILCLTVIMFVSTLFIPPFRLSSNNGITGLSAFGGVSNMVLYFSLNSYWSPYVDFNPFTHTWSLGLEEQFYLLFPLLFLPVIKLNRTRRVIPYITLFFLSILFNFFQQYRGDLLGSYYLLPGRVWELLAGVILYLILEGKTYKCPNTLLRNILSFSGFIILLIAAVHTDQNVYLWAVLPVLGTVLVLVDVHNNSSQRTLVQMLLEFKILRGIGKISYSLYLWHWPILVLLRWTIGFESLFHKFIYILLSLIMALLSFYLIERRVHSIRLRMAGSHRITVVIIVLFLSGFLLSLWINSNKMKLTLSVTKDSYIWKPWGVDRDHVDRDNQFAYLEGRRLFVVGDSHAAAYNTMVQTTALTLGIGVVVIERGGYHVGNLLYPMSKIGDKLYYEKLIERLKTEMKPGDILFLASLRMPELSDSFELLDIDSIVETFLSEESQIERDHALTELSQFLHHFDDMDIDILIDAPKPVLKTQPYRCSDWFNRDNPIAEPGSRIDKELLLQIREPVIKSMDILHNQFNNLYIWDPFYILCENDGIPNRPLFFDGDHLTGFGNRILIPSFKEKILEIWTPQGE